MGAQDQTLQAWNEVHGHEKPEDISLGEWIWGALQGDFNEERSPGQIGFDMGVSLIPVVDTICDVRDLCANLQKYRKEPDNKIVLFFLATTVIGFFPEVGTVVKGVLRIVWVYLRPLIKKADDITNVSKLTLAAEKAVEAALPKITEYLQHNHVAQWATNGKVPDIYKFVATKLKEAIALINPGTMQKHFNDGVAVLTGLLEKIQYLVPAHQRERIQDLLKAIDGFRSRAGNAIKEFTQPVRTVLNVIAKRLDDHAWRAQVMQTNRGWIAPLSESGAAKLINAKPPKWVRKGADMKFPPMEADAGLHLMKENPKHPKLQDWIVETFSKEKGGMRPGSIEGPAKLCRIVDPSNEAGGIFWMTEKEFKELKSRDEWRKRFAVKPDWNQNGWFVEYEIKAKEELNVWRGPAASQKLEGTDYHLVGGHEQIVFFPSSRDAMVQALPRIDGKTGETVRDAWGNVDRRVEFKDVTGETVPSKLRDKITDPRIKGPFETGWGAMDYTPQEAQRILLTAPEAK